MKKTLTATCLILAGCAASANEWNTNNIAAARYQEKQDAWDAAIDYFARRMASTDADFIAEFRDYNHAYNNTIARYTLGGGYYEGGTTNRLKAAKAAGSSVAAAICERLNHIDPGHC